MIAFLEFTKRYVGRVAVDRLTLGVEPGETVALLGPNGSGKTTVLKAAAGLIGPTAGQVLVGDPGRPPIDPRARRDLSFMPQRASFPESLTGREVLDFFGALRGVGVARRDEVLRVASLNGASLHPLGTYSGGMVQRLALAVAMLPDTPMLLLDEPTAALDADGLCAFYGLLERRKREGKTVFFSTHQIGDVERLVDRFAVLVNGRLAGLMTGSELRDRLAQRGVMRVRIGHRLEAAHAAARTLAPAATALGDELIVPGPAALRPAVLDAVRATGAEICGLTAEEGRLDRLYLELVERVRQ